MLRICSVCGDLPLTLLKKKRQENKVPVILWQKLNAHTVYALVK